MSQCSARIVGNARLRHRRGGIRPWPSVKRDIISDLKEDSGCLATMMVDFYGLPRDGDGAWPGRAEATVAQTQRKAALVEAGIAADLAKG